MRIDPVSTIIIDQSPWKKSGLEQKKTKQEQDRRSNGGGGCRKDILDRIFAILIKAYD